MSNDLNPEFVERCQILLGKDPKSRIFAPLAEAYRRMGLLKEAEDLAQKGVEFHPDFPSGRVVYAKILLDQQKLEPAVFELQKASELSPENMLAHRLLSQTLLQLKRPKEAMKSLKMILLLSPSDNFAAKTVARLESLTADEYDDELFEMKPLSESVRLSPKSQATHITPQPTQNFYQLQRTLDRALSLSDAFVARNDFDKAIETLDRAEEEIGPHPELTKRRRFLLSRQNLSEVEAEIPTQISPEPLPRPTESRVDKLKQMLRRVSDRRVST